MAVRRLTPRLRECERLQALPPGWTAVDGDKTPDSPRYAGLGDAMTASVAEWIARRILAAVGGDAP
jgi:site-specific DNA-cytosine methylase